MLTAAVVPIAVETATVAIVTVTTEIIVTLVVEMTSFTVLPMIEVTMFMFFLVFVWGCRLH